MQAILPESVVWVLSELWGLSVTYLLAVGALLFVIWAAVVLLALLSITKALEDLEGCKEVLDAYEAFLEDSRDFDEEWL